MSSSGRTALDGTSLRRDCELVALDPIFEATALRLRPLRAARGVLTVDAIAYTSVIEDDREVSFTVSRPDGGILGRASVTLPGGTDRGRAVRVRIRLTQRGRSQIGRLRRVRLTASTVGTRTVIDLPLRR